MHLTVYKDIDELSQQVADWITKFISDTLKSKDRFTIALSGGSTPKKLFSLLASEAYRDKIDWSKLHIFWGDERFVPFTDDRNNAKMAFDVLLTHVPVPEKQVHIMQTGTQPASSAAAYENILHQYFDGKKHTFDLVLLGLGDNAHTLSLFPGYEIVTEKQAWVTSFYLEQEKIFRITLTAPIVNQARRIAFLVSGGSKAASVYHVLYGEHNPGLYPAQVIQPYNDELYWFLDEAAAADIER
jgi:6-phosphogluconolactonase